ncbi:SLC13 family permease [soil metagenome]
MGWDAWVTIAVIAGTIAVLTRDLASPPLVVFGSTVLLLVLGVIDAGQAFSGFSNPAPITVAALYVLARAVEVSGAMSPVVDTMMGGKGDTGAGGAASRRRLARIVGPTAAGSAVLNNTPIVAAIAPMILDWCNRRGQSASAYLMPLSFAAILGGVVTAIGTSTNLVVSGQLQAAGLDAIGMFEITRVGLPIAVVGVLLLVALAPVLLPDRRGMRDDLVDTMREFSFSMRVLPNGPLDGVSLQRGGLRNLQGVYCMQIERGDRVIAPVDPDETLDGGDVLTFVGAVDQIIDLQRNRGLDSTEVHHLDGLDGRAQSFFEAVVGSGSPLVGATLKDVGFRARYDAGVLGIHRQGHRVEGKLGQIPLRVGDTLLVLGHNSFRRRYRETGDFLLIAPLAGSSPARTRKAPLVGLITVLLVAVAGAGLLPILEASLVAAFALVAFKVLTFREARDAVDLNVVVVIAAAFGLAEAITTTGLAETLAGLLVGAFAPLGVVGALLGVLVATAVLTEMVTNNAAAALMFPIAISTAQASGSNPRAFAIAVAVAASASFLTPIGYQTNTMVYGLGGYRFTDYVRLGLPITVAVLAVALAVIPVGWPL